MKKEKRPHILLRILAAVLLILAFILIANRYTVRQVWGNIFPPPCPWMNLKNGRAAEASRDWSTQKIQRPSMLTSMCRSQMLPCLFLS